MMRTRMAVRADINKILKLRMMQAMENRTLDNKDKYALKLATLAYLSKNISNIAVTDVNGDIVSASVAAQSAHWPEFADMGCEKTEIVFSYTKEEYRRTECGSREIRLLEDRMAVGGSNSKAA